jgi:nicotinate-nucleotide adenylyltransferase
MVIVYGGSFNPPTIAHYKIADYLIKRYNPNHFVFVPVGNSYHKPELAPFMHRFEMLKLLCKKLNHASVSDYENKPHFTGTIALLKDLENQVQDEIYFVLGADNLLTLDQWINYQELVKNYRFIVFERDNDAIEPYMNQSPFLKDYCSHFIIEKDFPKMDVAASRYRNHNEDHLVCDEINTYIYHHHLYNRGVK